MKNHILLKLLIPALLAFLLPFSATSSAASPQRLDSGITVEVRGEGRPVLMIPGMNSAPAVWNQTCQQLMAEQFACHLMHLPGFAGNPPVETDAFLDHMTEALLAYVNDAHLHEPVLMGHSLGGFLALRMAIESAEPAPKLGPLVIVDALPFLPAAYNQHITLEGARTMAKSMRQNTLAANDAQFAQYTRQTVRAMTRDPDRVDTLVQWGLASDRNTSALALYELMTTDLRGQLDRIAQPTLVLGSWAAYQNYGATRDSVASQYQGQYANIGDFTLAISDTGYHFLMWDDPEWLTEQVLQFIQ